MQKWFALMDFGPLRVLEVGAVYFLATSQKKVIVTCSEFITERLFKMWFGVHCRSISHISTRWLFKCVINSTDEQK